MKNTNTNILLAVIKKIDAFFNFLSKASAVICSVLLIGVTLIIFAGVINRAFFEFAWLFVEEYSSLALIPISYLAMAYTLRWNRHLKMDILIRNVPKKVEQILGIFATIFSLICICYMVYSALDWFTYTYERNVTSSGTLRTPLWFISSTIVAGTVLFAVDMALLTIHRVSALFTGEKGPLQFVDDEDSNDITEGAV